MLVQVGLDVSDLYTMDQPEDGANNARRMQRLWDLEVSRHKKLLFVEKSWEMEEKIDAKCGDPKFVLTLRFPFIRVVHTSIDGKEKHVDFRH